MFFSASDFFRGLTAKNRLARKYNFGFAEVSGLQGFIDAISQADCFPNVVCVDDTSDGFAELDNTPRRRAVKTVYIAMRHAPGDYNARAQCMTIMHDLFLQFLSAILPEKIRLEQGGLYLGSNVPFSEMDKYIATGAACAYFQISLDRFVDLSYNPEQWTE